MLKCYISEEIDSAYIFIDHEATLHFSSESGILAVAIQNEAFGPLSLLPHVH